MTLRDEQGPCKPSKSFVRRERASESQRMPERVRRRERGPAREPERFREIKREPERATDSQKEPERARKSQSKSLWFSLALSGWLSVALALTLFLKNLPCNTHTCEEAIACDVSSVGFFLFQWTG